MRAWRRVGGCFVSGREKGAVAVEFALILPVFLVLVLGIFEFGRAFNIQVSLSQAARESARHAAIGFSASDAQAIGVAAAPSVPLDPGDVDIAYSSGSACAADVNVTSTVTYETGFLTGLEKLIGVSQPFTLTGIGVMRCES